MAQSHETQTPEQNRPAAEINEALAYAQTAITHLRHDRSFHAACAEAGINPNSSADPQYWETFYTYVAGRVDTAKEQGEDSLRMDAIELLAATPTSMIEMNKLRLDEAQGVSSTISRPDYKFAKEVASHYNGLIRGFAENYPETSVRDLSTAVLTTISQTLHNSPARQSAAQMTRETIRGAQHELAFGQILRASGLPFREASREEDLMGVDYIVGDDLDSICVDVKASLEKIRTPGSANLFRVVRRGEVRMYSMTSDLELGDSFFIDEAAAMDKAPHLLDQLAEVRRVA